MIATAVFPQKKYKIMKIRQPASRYAGKEHQG